MSGNFQQTEKSQASSNTKARQASGQPIGIQADLLTRWLGNLLEKLSVKRLRGN